jgi:tetratricopeptide (TPR) repeat protein
VNNLLIGLVGAVLATNQPLAVSNVIQQQAGYSVAVANQNDPAENELRAVMQADDDSQTEVSDWIRTNTYSATTNAEMLAAEKQKFNQRIRARFDSVSKEYQNFLRRHPDSAPGFLAYGSFLNDIGDEESAKAQLENSRQLDPKNPAVWNNLANLYGEDGELTNAFADYAEAIRLNPAEPVYYQNFATTVYLFRKDAREFFHLTEPQVFDKALELYRQAMKLTPENFTLATDYAESYYGIKPLRTNDALVAWTNAFNVAHTDAERQGVLIHLARIKIAAGFFEQASNDLVTVTNYLYADLKKRLQKNLAEKLNPATNIVSEISTNILARQNFMAVTNNFSETTKPISRQNNFGSTKIKLSSPEADVLNLSTNLQIQLPPPRQ